MVTSVVYLLWYQINSNTILDNKRSEIANKIKLSISLWNKHNDVFFYTNWNALATGIENKNHNTVYINDDTFNHIKFLPLYCQVDLVKLYILSQPSHKQYDLYAFSDLDVSGNYAVSLPEIQGDTPSIVPFSYDLPSMYNTFFESPEDDNKLGIVCSEGWISKEYNDMEFSFIAISQKHKDVFDKLCTQLFESILSWNRDNKYHQKYIFEVFQNDFQKVMAANVAVLNNDNAMTYNGHVMTPEKLTNELNTFTFTSNAYSPNTLKIRFSNAYEYKLVPVLTPVSRFVCNLEKLSFCKHLEFRALLHDIVHNNDSLQTEDINTFFQETLKPKLNIQQLEPTRKTIHLKERSPTETNLIREFYMDINKTKQHNEGWRQHYDEAINVLEKAATGDSFLVYANLENELVGVACLTHRPFSDVRSAMKIEIEGTIGSVQPEQGVSFLSPIGVKYPNKGIETKILNFIKNTHSLSIIVAIDIPTEVSTLYINNGFTLTNPTTFQPDDRQEFDDDFDNNFDTKNLVYFENKRIPAIRPVMARRAQTFYPTSGSLHPSLGGAGRYRSTPYWLFLGLTIIVINAIKLPQ